MYELRQYQKETKAKIYQAWDEGCKIVMPVLPTGGGKTVVMGSMISEHDGDGFAMAHRSELVGQISMALATFEIKHSLVVSDKVRSTIQRLHIDAFGRSFIHPNADWHVGSVDTVLRRQVPNLRKPLILQDEGHHVLRDNKWGKALTMFSSDAKVILPTATPRRADNKGLGREHDGVVDKLILGPFARDLINEGMLTDYRVYAPDPQDLELEGVRIGTNGEFNQKDLATALAQSRFLVGGIVDTYIKKAHGKLAVCFAANIEEAKKITKAFNDAGVPAALVTGEDDELERRRQINKFKNRETLVLVNVDLFGEGFDLPAIEVVIMARPTDSFALFAQQWGRALRLMISPEHMRVWDQYTPEIRKQIIAHSAKPYALIFDHVGNVLRHNGPPDLPQPYSLEPPGRKNTVSEWRTCPECMSPTLRVELFCEFCGHDFTLEKPLTKVSGDNIKLVDGDLRMFTQEALDDLRKGIIRPDDFVPIPRSLAGTPAEVRLRKIAQNNQFAVIKLRNYMNCWSNGYATLPLEKQSKLFYLTFNVDVLTALTLKAKDAENLSERIKQDMATRGQVALITG